MAFSPSLYQARFFDHVATSRRSAVVKAVAGSGKSTSIAHAILRLPTATNVAVLMFNSDVAKDFRAKFAEIVAEHGGGKTWPNVRISTFHALGWSALTYYFKRRGINVPEVDQKKLSKLMRDRFAPDVSAIYGAFATKLASYAKGEGIGAIVPDTVEAWWEIVYHHDLMLETEEGEEAEGIEIARKLLKLSNEVAATGHVDFDDQLYLPLLWKLRLFQQDVLFVDEAQDTNAVRRALAKLALKYGGPLYAVGDDRQAIFGFTGATADAMNLIRREFDCVELPLTISYRCAKAIGEHARELVSYFETFEGAIEGKVEDLQLKDALKVLRPSDAVLCRNTKPLIELAYDLIGRGTGCVVLGRDIGQGLVAIVKKMKAAGLDRLLEKLEEYRSREVAKFTAKGEEGKAEGVNDRVECIVTIADRIPEGRERTVPGLIGRIEAMFSDHATGVLTLSTMHKSKGREWDRVAILRPDLCPSKWARQDWQKVQEENLMYVARTRAREHLIYLTADQPEPAPTLAQAEEVA